MDGEITFGEEVYKKIKKLRTKTRNGATDRRPSSRDGNSHFGNTLRRFFADQETYSKINGDKYESHQTNADQ